MADSPATGTAPGPRTLRAGTRVVHETEVRRSRFVATLARTDSEEEARDLLARIREDDPQARHHCSAWVLARDGADPLVHAGDDGEPSGTAGRPMLDVLRGWGVVDVTAVVTRHFGGVLLGTGGLVRAYSQAVAGALGRAPLVHLETRALLEVRLAPADAGRIEADLRARGALVLDTSWGDTVTLRLAVPAGSGDALAERVARLTGGSGRARPIGSQRLEVDEPDHRP